MVCESREREAVASPTSFVDGLVSSGVGGSHKKSVWELDCAAELARLGGFIAERKPESEARGEMLLVEVTNG